MTATVDDISLTDNESDIASITSNTVKRLSGEIYSLKNGLI